MADINYAEKKKKLLLGKNFIYKKLEFQQIDDTFPFWEINLEHEVKIKSIIITPANFKWYRIKNINIQFSRDGNYWEAVTSFSYFLRKTLIINFSQFYTAKKCRIVFSNKKIYEGAKVIIQFAENKFLFISSRYDGIGTRLLNLVNLMYFAKLSNSHFGFVWHEIQTAFEATTVCDEKKIFSKNFIEKYSYTDLLPKDFAETKHNAEILREIFIANCYPPQKYSLSDFAYMKPEYEWGWFFFNLSIERHFNEIDSRNSRGELQKIWNSIEFTEEFYQVQNVARKVSLNFKNYEAIHFRIFDIVYNCYNYRHIYTYKAMVVEFFIAFLLQELPKGKNFIIFTDALSEARELIRQLHHYKELSFYDQDWGNIIFSADLYKESDFDDAELGNKFFDLFLMAELKNIYAANSTLYSVLAKIVGNTNLIPIITAFKNENLYNIILHVRNNFHLDRHMLAFSALWCYENKRKLKINKEVWINLLYQGGFEADLESKHIMTINLLLFLKDYAFCDEYLRKLEEKNMLQKIVSVVKEGNIQYPITRGFTEIYKELMSAVKQCQKITGCYPHIQSLCNCLEF